jgi:hypothetical protein
MAHDHYRAGQLFIRDVFFDKSVDPGELFN